MPFLIPTIIKTSTMNTGDWLDANIKDEALKNVLTANLGYYTDDPYNLSLMYFLMAQGSYLNGGGNFVKGVRNRCLTTWCALLKSVADKCLRVNS